MSVGVGICGGEVKGKGMGIVVTVRDRALGPPLLHYCRSGSGADA